MTSPRDISSEVRDFSPGLNLHAAASNVRRGETDLAVNVEFLLDGSAVLRRPFVPTLDAANNPIALDNAAVPTLGVMLPMNEADIPSPRIFPQTMPKVWTAALLGSRRRIDIAATSNGLWTDLFTANLIQATGHGYQSIVGMAGNVYAARPDKPVVRLRLRRVNDVLTLQSLSLGTQYFYWSNDLLNPHGDVQAATANYSLFPRSDVLSSVNQGSSSFMLSAAASTLRWSHALSWVDSDAYGYTGFTGIKDPGPDWPKNSSNYRDSDQAKVRLFGPEDWAEHHYTDIAPHDGESITAIRHWFDAVLVFKQTSLWLLMGAFPDDVSLLNVSNRIGAARQQNTVITPYGVYWWSQPEGLHRWDQQSGVELVSPKIGNPMPDADADMISVSYSDHRLFVSFASATAQPDPTGTRVFVLDLRHNGWSEWDAPVGLFIEGELAGAAADPLRMVSRPVTHSAQTRLLLAELDEGSALPAGDTHDLTSAITSPIQAELRVGPARDEDRPDSFARWRRNRVEVESTSAAMETVKVTSEYHDTDMDNADRTETHQVEAGRRMMLRSELGTAARSMSVVVRWTASKLRLTGVIFNHWPGRRNR